MSSIFKNKKLLIISGVIIILAIVLIVVFKNKSQMDNATDETRTLVDPVARTWGNYSDESSDTYLNSLKPFYSTELFNQAKNDAEDLKKMSEKFGPALSSTFEIKSSKMLNASKDSATYEIIGIRKTPDINEEYEQTITLTFEKINGEWKVANIETPNFDENK